MPAPLADDFLSSARIAGELVRDPVVARRWEDESACVGMTVGGLAHHLAAQAGLAVRLLQAPPHDEPPISLEEHYRRAAWVRAGLDEDANTVIRDSANQEAEPGYDALAEQVRHHLAALPAALEAAESRRPDAVFVPWQGWALSAHDFLTVRLMELLVHSDDLASSVELPTPEFPQGAVRRVLELLTTVAVRRHGQTAVLRALSRPQRAPASVSAF